MASLNFYKHSNQKLIDNFFYQLKYKKEYLTIVKFLENNIENKLEKIINLVKELEIIKMNLCIIGLGGITFNFLEFLKEVYEYCLKEKIINSKLFNKLYIYENDILEWHNVLRLPIEYFRYGIKKIEYANKYKDLAKNLIAKDKYFDKKALLQLKKNNNLVFFGAFDIKTRKLFSQFKNVKAIYIGFISDNFYIFNQFEKTNYEILNETYGSIVLSNFFNKFRHNFHIILDSLIKTYYDKKIDIKI